MIPSESRGIAIPFQLGNETVPVGSTGGKGGAATQIGAATFTYTQGTGVTTACDDDIDGTSAEKAPSVWLNSTSDVHVGGLATGVNASDQAINNVVREARALANGTTSDFYLSLIHI